MASHSLLFLFLFSIVTASVASEQGLVERPTSNLRHDASTILDVKGKQFLRAMAACFSPNCVVEGCTENCQCFAAGCTLQDCKENCSCYAPNCNMPVCENNCNIFSSGGKMPMCESNCNNYAEKPTPSYGASCPQGGCDMTGCISNCQCAGGCCYMPDCTTDCQCAGGNCAMQSCTSNCQCAAGKCDQSACSSWGCGCAGGGCQAGAGPKDGSSTWSCKATSTILAIVLPIVAVALIVGAVFAYKFLKKKMTQPQPQPVPVDESEAVSFPVQQQPASSAYEIPNSKTDPLMSPPPQAAPLSEEVPSAIPTTAVPVVPTPGVASTEEVEIVVPVVPIVPTATNNQTESVEATATGNVKSAHERLEELERIKDMIGEESYNAKKAEILGSI